MRTIAKAAVLKNRKYLIQSALSVDKFGPARARLEALLQFDGENATPLKRSLKFLKASAAYLKATGASIRARPAFFESFAIENKHALRIAREAVVFSAKPLEFHEPNLTLFEDSDRILIGSRKALGFDMLCLSPAEILNFAF